MTVKERNGKYIVDTIWPDKKRTRRQAVNEKEAKKLNTRIRASRMDGTWRQLRRTLNMERVDPMKLSEAVEIYLEQYVKIKNRDRKSKKSRLSIFQNATRNPLLSEIDRAMVTRFAQGRLKDKISARTVNRDIAVLRHFLEWARKNDLVDANPLDEWERLAEKPFEGQRPTEKVINAVFAKLEPTAKPLFEFIRHTGCRREEALSLQWHQVDLRNDAVVFHKTKSGKPRTVPLTAEAIKAIRALPRTSKTQYVFYQPESMTRWSEAKGPWNRARKAAGHTWLRIHDLRHAYAIKLVEAAVPMEVVSEMLGHYSIDFTRKNYAKYSPSWAGKVVLAALEGGQKKRKAK